MCPRDRPALNFEFRIGMPGEARQIFNRESDVLAARGHTQCHSTIGSALAPPS